MQHFEPDQLVLVKYAGNTIWRLRRYSFCDSVHHETQDGSLWDDNQIMPYAGNEHMLGDIRKHPKKWEPTPGELVAVRCEPQNTWTARIFIKMLPHGKYACAMYTGKLSGYTLWDHCEPLRKHFNVPEE